MLHPTPTKIGSLILDCVLREGHEMTSKVTDFPVEEGVNIADHIQTTPRELTVEGLISNTPVRILGDRLDRQARGTIQHDRYYGENPNRAQLAFQELEKMCAQKQLVTITGRFKTYENMAMLSAPVVCDPTDGDALRFTATFRQVTKVSLKTAVFKTAFTKKETAQPRRDTGKRTPAKSESAVEKRASILKSTWNAARGR